MRRWLRCAALAEGVRVDKWLWCVRLFKTRTAATKACDAGDVLVETETALSEPIKPARRVREGDVIVVKRKTGTTKVIVRQRLEKRVSAALAAEAYDDISPEPTAEELEERALRRVLKTPTPGRDRGTGRPTKRDRRRLDEFRGRSDTPLD